MLNGAFCMLVRAPLSGCSSLIASFFNKISIPYHYLILSAHVIDGRLLWFIFKTDKLNFLVYSLLMILLVNADGKVILKLM